MTDLIIRSPSAHYLYVPGETNKHDEHTVCSSWINLANVLKVEHLQSGYVILYYLDGKQEMFKGNRGTLILNELTAITRKIKEERYK